MVYTPGNEVCFCRPPPRQRNNYSAESQTTAPGEVISLRVSGITDVFEVNLAELYLLPVKSCGIRVSTLHLNYLARTSRVFRPLRHRSTSDSVQDKQQISETSVSPAILDAKWELFMFFTREVHSLQSSQAPQIHLFLT